MTHSIFPSILDIRFVAKFSVYWLRRFDHWTREFEKKKQYCCW